MTTERPRAGREAAHIVTERIAILVVVALVTVACGSTVPTVQQQAAEEAAQEGVSIEDGGLSQGGASSSDDFGSGGLSGTVGGSAGTAVGDV